jgi:hypothetical protein
VLGPTANLVYLLGSVRARPAQDTTKAQFGEGEGDALHGQHAIGLRIPHFTPALWVWIDCVC